MMPKDHPHLRRPLVAWHSFVPAVSLCLNPILHLPIVDCTFAERKAIAELLLLMMRDPVVILLTMSYTSSRLVLSGQLHSILCWVTCPNHCSVHL